jgi:hypothetical protein
MSIFLGNKSQSAILDMNPLTLSVEFGSGVADFNPFKSASIRATKSRVELEVIKRTRVECAPALSFGLLVPALGRCSVRSKSDDSSLPRLGAIVRTGLVTWMIVICGVAVASGLIPGKTFPVSIICDSLRSRNSEARWTELVRRSWIQKIRGLMTEHVHSHNRQGW